MSITTIKIKTIKYSRPFISIEKYNDGFEKGKVANRIAPKNNQALKKFLSITNFKTYAKFYLSLFNLLKKDTKFQS